jgi:hypothetical protein
MGKIELKFWQIIFYMGDRTYIKVYGDGKFFFLFFTIVPEIPCPQHREIQEFGQIFNISAMKFSNFTWSTALLQVHYDISFEVMSQRLK